MSNPFQQLDCLVASGAIADDTAAQVKKMLSVVQSSGDKNPLLTSIQLVNLGTSGVFSGTPLSTQSITSTDTVDVKTLTVPEGATNAIISIHGNNIIFRTDGGTPSSGNGHYGTLGENFTIGGDLSQFKFVSTSTTDGVIFVSYF